jgi:hypothetical protein
MEGNNMAEKRTITLPSGATATFRDPATLRVKDRKKVLRAANGEEGLMQALSIVDGLIAILIEEWSFDMLLPSIKVSVLDELTMADYDALSEEAGKAQAILFPGLTENDKSANDPDSPFENSNA